MSRIRIRKFLGLPDLDPLVRGTDPDPNPSIIKKKCKETPNFHYFVTFLTYYL
jgi:hypothetical protein